MPSQPFVSCIITNYNYGHFLDQAIDSVLHQTYPNIEVIVIDDGSTDDSAQIVKPYRDQVAFVQQTNSGVVVARNAGAKRSTSDYIFFLDADDYIHPQFVEQLISALIQAQQTNPQAAIAYCDQQYVGHSQAIIPACSWNVPKLLYRNYLSITSIMTKQAFDSVGGFSTEVNQTASFEDWDLWLSLAEQGWTGVYVPQVLFFYRLHGDGRNGPALQHRAELEVLLHSRHSALYNRWSHRLYLAIFATASKWRNRLIPPPGSLQS